MQTDGQGYRDRQTDRQAGRQRERHDEANSWFLAVLRKRIESSEANSLNF